MVDFQFQAFDFRTTTRNEPFLQLFHFLYVYPLTVSLSRKRNLYVRVELREDDADIRRQPLEVYMTHHFLYKISVSFMKNCSLSFYICATHLSRRCIQGSMVQHFKDGLTHKLLLGLGWPPTMMRLNFPSLLPGHQLIIFYSLSSMLTFKQNWKLQSL